MTVRDCLILLPILLWFVLAVRHTIRTRRRGGCGCGCSGDCASCGARCSHHKNPQKQRKAPVMKNKAPSRSVLLKIVFAAVLAALTCVATMVVTIPSPMGGFLNLGDGFVLLSGWLLGPAYGFAAAGLGSALADLLLGYAYYVPGTFVIKGLRARSSSPFSPRRSCA